MPPSYLDADAGGKQLPFTGVVRQTAFAVAGACLGGAGSLVAWLVVGGWGPPAMLGMVAIGMTLGVAASLAQPGKRRSPRGEPDRAAIKEPRP